jgi:RNA polymerase sigma-70 factor (ECF subfamily)
MRAEKRDETVARIGDEFWECVPADEPSMEDEIVMGDLINGFLRTLSVEQRIVFVQRYFYLCPIREIAKLRGMTENHVKVTLHRLRERMKAYWEAEGREI